MRSIIGISVACGALVLAATAPAHAADFSGQEIGRAYSILMTNAEGKSLAGGTKMMSTFAVASATKGSPDGPWLCDLSGVTEVEGKGGDQIVSVEFLSQKGQGVGDASQEIHVYGTANQAKRAYDGLVKRVKQCEGDQQPAADDDTPGEGDDPTGFTTRLTNGSKKAADGDGFLWVRSTTTTPGPDAFAEHGYTTVRHFGRYVQIVQVQSEGTNAANLTAKQIRTADKLTDSLGDRWRAAFG